MEMTIAGNATGIMEILKNQPAFLLLFFLNHSLVGVAIRTDTIPTITAIIKLLPAASRHDGSLNTASIHFKVKPSTFRYSLLLKANGITGSNGANIKAATR